jgi:endogenous inhibitor of DNA gyrase (YacG/DUF329 family)
MKCPICEVEFEHSEAGPFCSSRCRQIDLGQWLSGKYIIAGEKNVDETSGRRDEE